MTGTPVSPDPTRTAGAATDDPAGASLEDRLADRTRELDELTRQHAATVEILDIVARSPAGLQPALDAVVGAAVRHCGADDATMFLREGTEMFGAAHEGPLPSGFGNRRPIGGSPLDALIVRDGQTIHAPDTEALDPVEFASVIAVARQRGVRALVGAPIRHAGEVIGFLLLRRREVGPFTARQIATLETLATQAGVAVANAGVITELRQSLEQQTATAEVLQVINASPGDTAPVFETILQKTHALCGIAYGSLQLYDGQTFRAVATHNLPEPLAMRLREGYVPGPRIRQLIDGVGFSQFPDIGLVDEPMAKAAAESGLKTLLSVALRKDGRLLGQIVCARMEVRSFTDREIALLQGFAAQAVIAIENTRLITETREALDRQTAMAEVLAAINANPGELTPVFDAILEKAHRLCGSAIGNLSLYDGARLRRVAFRGMSGETSAMVAEPRSISDLHSRLVRGDRFVHVADLDAADAPRTESLAALRDREGIRSFVLVPLRREGAFLGYISANWAEPRSNVAGEVALLESFADQAVIAIENARLLREQREALERQTAMAEVLAVINANPGELTPVFDAILDKALSLSGSSIGMLVRFDGEKGWLVAGRNVPPAVGDVGLGGFIPAAGTLFHRMVLGDDVAFLADIRDDEAYRAGVPQRVILADEGGARSLLTVALRKDDRLLGGIQVYRTEVRAFSEAEVALVRAFADQAVIAMENARLITETREALERQTAMAEVLAVINASPGDLTPVFGTILDKALSLSGSSLGFLVRFDGEKFWQVAWQNTPPAVRDLGLGGYMPEAGTHLHRLVLGDDVAYLADITDDEAYRAGVPSRVIMADEAGARSLLTVALRKDGRLLGGIQVYRTEVRAFSEAEVALVRAFADQAVIAMENARLLTETKEALERQTAMAEVLEVISNSVEDTQPVFEKILESCQRLIDCTDISVLIIDADDLAHVRAARGPHAWLTIENYRPIPVGQTVIARAVEEMDTVHIRDALEDDDVPEVNRRLAAKFGNLSCLITPLIWRGRCIGAVHVARSLKERNWPSFTDKDIALLKAFADQAVVAIQNARLITETREALEQQTATAEVLQVINASPGDLAPVFEAILAKAHDLCGATMGSLNLFDGGINRAVATRGMDDAFSDFLRRGTPMSGVTSREHTRHIADLFELARQEPDNLVWRTATEIGQVRTMLGVPLVKDGNALGRIIAARREVRPFTESQIALLENFAAQAVIAMENARLLEQIRQRQAELRVTFDNMGDGVAMFDAEPRLAAWNRNFERIVGVPEDRLADRPSYAQYLRLLAERGEFGTENVEAELASRLEDTERELRLERTRADGTVIEVRRNAVPGGGFVLIYSDVTQRRKAEAAIREARDAAEAALEQQTATSEILRVISQSPTDVQPVFEVVVKAAVRLCGAQDAIVVMRDGSEVVFEAHEGPLGGDRGARWPLDWDNAMGRAIIESRIVHIPDTTALGPGEFTRTQHGMVLFGFKAIVAAPLMRDGRATGALLLRKPEPGPFTPRQIELLEIFAAQAVIAIENVRLFTELRESLERLKAAQANLVQSEKMASLGQLTAGIAHEIKNPLNFVNNFASLSVELLAEIREVAAPAFAQLDEDKRAEIDETMELITGNLEKIAEHGKRADGIVKSMLSHSRGGTGDWQAVDINALVEEALNLAFHGARAQDKNFNVTLERDLAPASTPIEVVPQDVTRVFLNLFGNGFYAANKRRMAGTEAGFKPLLRVSTRDLGETFEIKVRDNGTGISDEVRAKLFQPFFTTKPTGEGTGLGLSISYDIVTQQHGGTIEVESEVGSFTEFTVRLPRSRRVAPAERTG